MNIYHMPCYRAKARTNYLKIKDEAAFLQWAELRGFGVWKSTVDDEDAYILYVDSRRRGDGSWPTEFEVEENGKSIWIDPFDELAKHLKDGTVAIMMELGSYGFRDFGAYAMAINSKGETVDLRLHDIYHHAKHLGKALSFSETLVADSVINL